MREAPGQKREKDEAPFDILSGKPPLQAAVFASPHSGRIYPADMGTARGIGIEILRLSEDRLVDKLVAPATAMGFPLISARLGRAYLDLNRAPDELDEHMLEADAATACRRTAKVAAGLGVIPRVGADGRRLYGRRLSETEVRRRLETVHAPYHAALGALLEAARAEHGASLLIDWHSMPSGALADPRATDMVLGDRHGASCAPEVTAWLESLLIEAGFGVARNTPYAGGHGAERHGAPAACRHAIQVEINRAAYLDERTLAFSPRTEGFTEALGGVFARMAGTDWPALLRRA